MDSRLLAYKKVNVNTTNRGKIVVMLYSGAITFLNKAIIYSGRKDYFNKGKFINKAQNIIDELNYSLDMKKGKSIAKNLRGIYIFLGKHLTKANISNDSEMIEKAITILETLKSAFDEIVNNPKYSEAQVVNKQQVAEHAIRRFV